MFWSDHQTEPRIERLLLKPIQYPLQWLPTTSRLMVGGALTGPCSLCGAKSSVGWRRLPECARDKAGDPACNACFVSVWKCHREDPDGMDAMLAARAALQTAPRPKRRRRGMKLVRSRPNTSKAAGKKREHIGSTPRRQSSQSSDSDHESSQRNATDGTGSKPSGSSSTEEEEAIKQHAKERQHQEAEQQQREQSLPPPPPLPHQQQSLPPPQQSPDVALPPQMLQRQQEQPCPSSPLEASTQRYQLSPLHSVPLPPPPPLPRAQQQQQQQPSLAPPAAGLVQPPLHAAPLPPPPLLPFLRQQQQQQPPPAAPPAAAQQQSQLLPHATGLPPPPPLPQLLPHVLLPQQPQLLPLPQPLSTVVGAPQPLWAAQLNGTPGPPLVLGPGFQATSLQQLVVDMRSSSSQEAASRAWLAACELPGARPQLLGLLPAMWVQAAGGPVQLAGVLLVHVLLPPPGLSFEAQQALLVTGQGLQPELRLVVYCFQTGRLLHSRERLGQEECLLQLNPCHDMQAWDSREGWQLLFPEAGARKEQVALFANLVLRFGRPLRPDQIPGAPKAAAAAAAAVQPLPQQPPPQQQQQPLQPPPASFPASHLGQPPAAAGAAAAAAGQRFPSSGHWCSGLPDSLSDAPLLLEVVRGAAGITDDELRFLCTILDPTSPDEGGSGGGHAG